MVKLKFDQHRHSITVDPLYLDNIEYLANTRTFITMKKNAIINKCIWVMTQLYNENRLNKDNFPPKYTSCRKRVYIATDYNLYAWINLLSKELCDNNKSYLIRTAVHYVTYLAKRNRLTKILRMINTL